VHGRRAGDRDRLLKLLLPPLLLLGHLTSQYHLKPCLLLLLLQGWLCLKSAWQLRLLLQQQQWVQPDCVWRQRLRDSWVWWLLLPQPLVMLLWLCLGWCLLTVGWCAWVMQYPCWQAVLLLSPDLRAQHTQVVV
jgi:hypothetical protein